MRLHLSRLHYPVTTLGPGSRIGIWLQGCTLRCPGCISTDTWDRTAGETTVKTVLEAIEPWLRSADGVTISGGEPLQQHAALVELMRGIRNAGPDSLDILVYSGYDWKKIEKRVAAWKCLADALIAGPFDSKAGQTLIWRGSDNQTLHPLTALGNERYASSVSAPRDRSIRALDLCFHEGEVWMAGIPEEGTLETLRRELAAAGYSSENSQLVPLVLA